MRHVKNPQLHFDEVNIADIKFDARSRDDIPAILKGLQYIYAQCINNLEVRGLNRCLSYGRDGFERHVALSIVATNLHRIGLLLQRKALARLRRKKPQREHRSAA